MQQTKMVCTLGPASSDSDTVTGLVRVGMDVARLNFSHDTHDGHRKTFDVVRAVARELGANVAIMADLQGPKIRTGKLEGGAAVTLESGASICLTTEDVLGNATRLATTYQGLPGDVAPGDRILVADGTIEFAVENVNAPEIECRVVQGGVLGEHKGINLPGVAVSAPSITEKDWADLAFAQELGVDFVALSFVRSPNDVRKLKNHMEESGRPIPVVAKIERPEALEQFDEILEVSDVIMVARGDLGVEVDLDDVPQIQKRLIRKCNLVGVPVITATQMLESMMTNPRPTRAEANDVANAIYDGTDAVMLSGETAAGRFPIKAAQTMAQIAAKADTAIADTHGAGRGKGWRQFVGTPGHADAIGHAVSYVCQSVDVARIVCFTASGFSAKMIARHRPWIPVTAITMSEHVQRQLALVWGVDPEKTAKIADIDEMVAVVDEIVLRRGLADVGDTIVIVAGTPLGGAGKTNMLKLHTVGSET